MLSEAQATGTPAASSSVTRVSPRGGNRLAPRPCKNRLVAGSVIMPIPASARPAISRCASSRGTAESTEQ